MRQKYFAQSHPLLVDGVRGSHSWRRIYAVQVLAEEHIFWTIREGRVDFWRDKWAMEEPLIAFCSMEDPPQFQVSDFFNNSSWNAPLLCK